MFGKTDLTQLRTLLIESGEVYVFSGLYLTVGKTESGNIHITIADLKDAIVLLKEQLGRRRLRRCAPFYYKQQNAVNLNINL